MSYATITKEIDLLDHIERHIEVEVEVDWDDMKEEVDADELVDALTDKEDYSELATRVYDCSSMLTAMADHSDKSEAAALALAIIKTMGEQEFAEQMELLDEKVTLPTADSPLSPEALLQDMDPLYGLVNRLSDVQKRSLRSHIDATTPAIEPEAAEPPVPPAEQVHPRTFASARELVETQSRSHFTVGDTIREYLNQFGVDYMLSRIRDALTAYIASRLDTSK